MRSLTFKNALVAFSAAAALLALLLAVRANLSAETDLSRSTVPTMISYQGQVSMNGVPYSGTGYFKFAIVNNNVSTLWSNDGSSKGGSEPKLSVPIAVDNGLFSILLGESIRGMSEPITADVFRASDRQLRVWFSADDRSYRQLSPDRQFASVPFAFQAANADQLDGLHASEIAKYGNVIVVAKSGGDYTSIQSALDSITDASANNRYLVWVAPGVYNEQVVMKANVDIVGAGQKLTKIRYEAADDFEVGAVMGANNAELRSLSVLATAADIDSVAIGIYVEDRAPTLTDITVTAMGGEYAYGIVNYTGAGTIMNNLTVEAKDAAGFNYAIRNYQTEPIQMNNVVASAFSGDHAYGIQVDTSNVTINNSTFTATGSEDNRGVDNRSSSEMTIVGGTARVAGGSTRNVAVSSTTSSLTLKGVTVVSDGGVDTEKCIGIYSDANATAVFNSDISAGVNGSCDVPIGFYNISHSGSHAITVDGSIITAASPMQTFAYSGSTYSQNIGTTKYESDIGEGFITSPGAVCAFVYDKDYVTTIGPACPN